MRVKQRSFRGGEREIRGKEISTPSQADRRISSHLFYAPVLDFFVDLLCDVNQEGLSDFAYIEAIAPLEGVEPITSDAALISYQSLLAICVHFPRVSVMN